VAIPAADPPDNRSKYERHIAMRRAKLEHGRNGLMVSLILPRDGLQRVLDCARIDCGIVQADVPFPTAFWAEA
jgi:hypothetical protein